MKKGLIVSLAIVAVLAASYPGLAWFCGKTVETRLGSYQKRALVLAPYVTVVDRKYERGVYRSTEVTTYELFHALLASVPAAQAANAGTLPVSLKFTVRSEIVHGPLPGFGPPALARIETEFVLSDSIRQELKKAFGDRKPMDIVTLLDFSGGGVTRVTSPAFDGFPIGNKGETLSWKGLTARSSFGPDLAWTKSHGEAPGMEAKSPEGEVATFDRISFDTNAELAFEDLYLGDFAATVKTIRLVPGTGEATPAAKSMSMEGFAYSAKLARAQDDFLDGHANFAIGSMDVDATKLSDLHYEVSLKHLHGETVAAIARVVRKALGEGLTAPVGANGATVDQEIRRLGIELLKRDPELVVDRISFAMPEGDASLRGSVHLVGFEPSDLEGSAGAEALVPKVDARFDIDLAEGLLRNFAEKSDGAAQLEQQLAAFEAQGYVTRSGGRVTTHLEFRQGALTLNGKAFSPQAVAPPSAPQGTTKPPRDTTHT
jgi:uncharacterized protein YdgA (DUF945 family)